MVRLADNHWVKQYSGLLCILNADGEVLSWKMTKSLSFASMEDMLYALSERFKWQGKEVEEFFIDNCCTLRSKLQSVFGEQLRVYLDLFHAVQRISSKIPKRHPYRHECAKGLRLVFRDPSDQGPVRTKTTPTPDILHQQLLQFQETWKEISYNNKPILPPIAIKEIRCLLVHVRKGCLSGILPGRGTNRNERLHKDINSYMKSNRYGVELAYGLITESLFKHNENIRGKKENSCALPITAYDSTNIPTCIEKFGLHTNVEHSAHQSLHLQAKVKMRDLKHCEVQDVLQNMDINLSATDSETLEHDSIDLTEDEALSILSQAISAYYVTISIKNLTTTADFTASNAFFLSSLRILESGISGDNRNFDNKQLELLLTSWNLRRVSSLGNGDCLFSSVAYCLIHRMEQGDTAIKQQMMKIGVPEVHLNDLEYIQRLLRTRMVEEWQQNVDNYQGYIIQDLGVVSRQYLQDGQFAGDAGDLMVLTLANVLSMPITVFTSVQNMPVLCVLPTSQTVVIADPLFLAFTQHGPGHYDAVVPLSYQNTEATAEIVKCNCGRKANFEGDACSSRRCKCFRTRNMCKNVCRCKSCNNKYGVRPPVAHTRKRKSYEEQDKQPLSGRLTVDFMSNKSEDINKGHLTLLENLLLKGIVIYLIVHGLQVMSKTVLKIFQIIHDICIHCESVDFPILERSESVIHKF